MTKKKKTMIILTIIIVLLVIISIIYYNKVLKYDLNWIHFMLQFKGSKYNIT